MLKLDCELKRFLRENKIKQADFAKSIGITLPAFDYKCKKGCFRADEIDKARRVLRLSDAETVQLFIKNRK